MPTARNVALLALAAWTACGARAASNVDSEHTWAESEYIGVIDWRTNDEFGAAINQYYCSGFLYSYQTGWISLGSGAPADALRYKNNSATDFGVNVLGSGALRGFAYGANIGWIGFEEQGNPRVDWTTGKLSGSIYSANTGWIPLSGTEGSLRLENAGHPADVDNDDLPDAWEMSTAGTLAHLSGNTDSDSDGQNDLSEFQAGTNPLDAAELLGPVRISAAESVGEISVSWQTKPGHVYLVERRESLESGSNWQVATIIPIVGPGGSLSIDLVASNGPEFFRVRAFPPLTTLY